MIQHCALKNFVRCFHYRKQTLASPVPPPPPPKKLKRHKKIFGIDG